MRGGSVPCVTGFIFWISVVLTFSGRAARSCAPSFRDFPRHRCCGLVASFPGPCASSGGRLPEELFMVFLSDSKGAKVCFGACSRNSDKISFRSRREIVFLMRKLWCFDWILNIEFLKIADDFWLIFLDWSGAKVCKSCRFRKMQKNEYLVAKIGFDTAENEPLQV